MKWFATALLAVVIAMPAAAQESSDKKPKRKSDVIATWEIDAIRQEVSSAYDIVQRLRSQFLRGRGSTSVLNQTVPLPKVILDGSPRGELDALRGIPALQVAEIRYLKAADATTQYGTNYDGGAIVVKTTH